MTEHVVDDLEAYALGALDRADAERVAAHLAECGSCRREAASLAEIVGELAESVPLREPRAALRERVLAVAAGADRPAPPVRPAWSPGRIRPWPVLTAVLASAVVILGAANIDANRRLSAVTAERDASGTTIESIREGARTWYMAGKDAFAGSGATLYDPRADGKQPFVLFHDLPPLPRGKVLTIWLVSSTSTWARAANFVPDGRDVQVVPISMEVGGFDRCAVTLEDAPWGPRYGTVVMESRIAPPATGP